MCLDFNQYETNSVKLELNIQGFINCKKNVIKTDLGQVFSRYFNYEWKPGVNKSDRVWWNSWFNEFFRRSFSKGFYVFTSRPSYYMSGYFIIVKCRKEHFLGAQHGIALFSQVEWDGKLYQDFDCLNMVKPKNLE